MDIIKKLALAELKKSVLYLPFVGYFQSICSLFVGVLCRRKPQGKQWRTTDFSLDGASSTRRAIMLCLNQMADSDLVSHWINACVSIRKAYVVFLKLNISTCVRGLLSTAFLVEFRLGDQLLICK